MPATHDHTPAGLRLILAARKSTKVVSGGHEHQSISIEK